MNDGLFTWELLKKPSQTGGGQKADRRSDSPRPILKTAAVCKQTKGLQNFYSRAAYRSSRQRMSHFFFCLNSKDVDAGWRI